MFSVGYIGVRLSAFVFLALVCMRPAVLIAAEKRTTLEQVDHVIQKAGSVSGLLAETPEGHAHRDAYYEALRNYFDHPNFTRESYDAVLNQLQRVTAQAPELGPRLWETTNTGVTFELSVPMNGSGRVVGEKWESKFMDYLAELERNGGGAIKKLPDGHVALDDARVESLLRSLKADDDLHRKSRSALSRQKDRAALDAAFYKKTRQSADFKTLASAFARNFFEQEQVKDWMATKNSDVILETLKDLYRSPHSGVPESLHPMVPEGMSSAMKDVSLDPEILTQESAYQKLLQDTRTAINRRHPLPDGLGPGELAEIRRVRNTELSKVVEEFNAKRAPLFPVPIDYTKMSLAQIVPSRIQGSGVVFRAIPRRLHGIWKGITLGECVGGRYCGDDWLTPRRWATSALAGTQVHFVEVDKVYQGFTQQTPVMINKKLYGSLELGSSALANRIVIRENGIKRSKALYEMWLPEADRRKPSAWNSLVLGKSDDINNAGVLGVVRTTDSFNLKPPILNSKVQLVDEAMAEKIEAAGMNTRYGRRMIIDAIQNEGSELRSLTPAVIQLKSKEHLIKLLSSSNFAKNRGFAEAVLRQIPKSWFNDEKVFEAIFSQLGNLGHWSKFSELAKALPENELRFKFFAAAYARVNKADGSVARIFESLIGRTETSGNPWDGINHSHFASFKLDSLDAKVALLQFVDKFWDAPGMTDAQLSFMRDVQNDVWKGAESLEAFGRVLDQPEGPGRGILLEHRIHSPVYQEEILKRLNDPAFRERRGVLEALQKSSGNVRLKESEFWTSAMGLLAEDAGCAKGFRRLK